MEENGEKDVPSQNWMAAQGGRPRDPFFTTISRPGSILVQHDRSLVRFPCGGATRTGCIRDEEITREGNRSIEGGRAGGRVSRGKEKSRRARFSSEKRGDGWQGRCACAFLRAGVRSMASWKKMANKIGNCWRLKFLCFAKF